MEGLHATELPRLLSMKESLGMGADATGSAVLALAQVICRMLNCF